MKQLAVHVYAQVALAISSSALLDAPGWGIVRRNMREHKDKSLCNHLAASKL
jgi:hypothetical protein